jgi:predicted phosphate transport protein (TIGR00153 family)
VFSRLMPREERFFDLFDEHAAEIVKGARELLDLMKGFDDLARRVYNIESIEKRADKIAHSAIDMLHKTFITPIDRDDIHQLMTRMDDVLDLIEDVAQSFSMYDIRSVTPEAMRLAELCLACAEQVQKAVALLHKRETIGQVMAVCEEIDRLESEADHVFRAAMAKLFRDEPDVRQVIKLRTVYELMESVTDRCEDVANIIEGIVIESS